MRTKLRITLYSEGENPQVISDRLVEQSTEFSMGPKVSHKGPLALELNLATQEDIENSIEYLRKLSGSLPIAKPDKKLKSPKGKASELSDEKPLEDFLEIIKSKANQDEIIAYLRVANFRMLTYQNLLDNLEAHSKDPKALEGNNPLKVNQKYEDYSFMVRLVKEAKDPRNDKWDFRLVFGFKILGGKTGKVLVYLWGKLETKLSIPWEKESERSYKPKDDTLTFPEFMDYEMRTKFRQEYRKWSIATKNGKEPDQFNTSKFFNKWKPYVKITRI